MPNFKASKRGRFNFVLNKSSTKALCCALEKLKANDISVLSLENSALDGKSLASILQSLPPNTGDLATHKHPEGC
jgi:hypothetical protein